MLAGRLGYLSIAHSSAQGMPSSSAVPRTATDVRGWKAGAKAAACVAKKKDAKEKESFMVKLIVRFRKETKIVGLLSSESFLAELQQQQIDDRRYDKPQWMSIKDVQQTQGRKRSRKSHVVRTRWQINRPIWCVSFLFTLRAVIDRAIAPEARGQKPRRCRTKAGKSWSSAKR